MIRYASENGYDQIAWTTGKQQAARYDLAKQVKRINLVNPHFDESGNVTRGWLEAYTLSGQQAINREVTAQELPNIIGKEASDRLMNSPSRREGFKTSGEGIHILEGEGLTVGTQGMAGFYDTILPEVANKLGKKFGARVGTTNVGIGKINLNIIEKDGKYLLRDEGDVVAIFDNYAEAANALRDNRGIRTEVVHSLVITPQMKQAAMEEGFPLFSAPEIGGATVGGIAYQDDPNLSPQENLARRAAGVAAGGLAGYGARRLGMKSRLGGTVEDVGQGGIVKPLSASVARDVGNPNFQRWFSGSQVVDEAGLPKPVFRGDYRADLLGSKLEKKRATSGRFYFTEDPTIAGNYAAGKPDLALIEKNADYENWFKFPPDQGARTQNNLRSQWYRLSPEQQARVKDVMLKTGLDDSNNFDFTGANPLTGADHWNYEVRKARGNWLEAGKETWLNSGSLFGDEERFVDILEQAGLRPKFNSPYVERPGVTPVYLNIRRPLDTSSIPAEVVDRLMAVAKADRTRGAQYKWDQWDKNANAKVFMERLEKDLQEGTTFAWTSVPEKITQELQRMGYDGIKDVGGKMGGKEHAVWIAFEPEQVKSALGNKGTFNPDSANMLRSAPEIGGAIVGGLSADATTDPNATEGERWRNRLLGIIGGGALGYGGRRLGGISRLGGTLEDASNYIDDVARRFDEINTRLAEITPRLEQQANTDIRRAVSGKMRGTIQRPPNAGSLQNSQLEEIARTHDLNPYETAWWESLDPEALKEIGPGQRSSKLAAVQGAGDAAELKALNKEYMGLKAEMDRLTAEFDAGAEAALAKPANTPADVRQALGGLGSDMGRSIREADLREAEKQMVKLRVKNPQVTDEQAAQTSLGQQIARLRGGTGVQGAGVPDLPLSAAEAAAVPVPARSSLGAPPEPAASVPVEQRSLPSLSSSAAKAATGDLAKAAGKTLARAKGTPEQASALRPAEEGFAGNVKLSKFDEAGVSDVIKQTVDSPEFNQFAGQRRGVITDAQAVQNAADLTDPAKGLGVSIEDWLKSKPGRAFNQEEAIALGQTLAKTGQDYQNLLGEVTEARTAGTATSVMESQLADKALEFAALAAVRSGSAAEAGRTLRSFRTALTGEGASRTNAINEAFKHLGGTEQFTKWVEQFSQIDPSDKVAQYKMLQALYSPTLWDKINAWRYASMLSSWKTHFVNFSGNAGQAMVRPLTTALAGYPKEAAADVYGMMRGIPEAWAAAGDAFATGVSKFNVTQIETSQFGNIRPKPIGGLVGKVINPVSDVLTAADEFWKSVNYSGALHANAYRLAKGDVLKAERLLANPDKDMILQASEVAKYAVYQNDPGKFVNAFIRFANTPGPTGTVVKLIVPFIRTPANIYIRGLGMVLQPLAGPIKMGIKASKGDIRGVRMEAAKTLMASSVLAGLWGMVSSGNLTGQGPTNLTRRRVLEESGWQANSIKVPDPTQPSGWRWISYNNLGPLSVPMAFVAAVKEGLDEGRRPNHELALDVVSRVYNSMLDASFLRGVSDLFRAQNPATWATQNAASIAGSFVPYGSGLAAVERIVDPTIRAKDTPIAAVQGRIPFASLALPKEPSVYGGIRQTGPGDTIAQMIVPWQTSTKRPDPVAQEVARLTQAGTPVSVRQFSDTYAGAKQTPEQQRLLQGQAGKMAATYIADTISKSEYQVLDDQGKSATLNRMIGTAYDMADINLGNQVARDPRHQALIAWASVPHFLGVNGTPQEIQTQNYEISNAKALLSDYVQRYGQNEGKRKLFDANPTLSVLARRGELDGAYLKKKRAEVDKQFGGALSQTEQQGLVGASNTLVPVGGSR
ncbi:MAG: hypothetical protein Q7O66_17505 [Dehalococcoidia bacterium]|nr:hypothetical protein [Dehalococcoidia bacterium]